MQRGNYTFPRMERVVYGKPGAQTLAAEVERVGAKRVFLLVSRSLNRTTHEVARLREALGGRCAVEYDDMSAHTSRDKVIEAAELARSADADLVVTFGGGSITDAGKMIRLCLQHGLRDMDAIEPFRLVSRPDGGQHVPRYRGPRVEQIAIPTTLSGGEFSMGASCTDPRSNVKHAWAHPMMMPRSVILDPALAGNTPEWLWLSTGVRAIDHCVEGLCSTRTNAVCDAAFVHALRLLARALPRVKSAPGDLEARLDCQFGAWLSMTGIGSGMDKGASHAIGHVLGGTCGVSHGYTSCVMLPAVLRWNAHVDGHRQQYVADALGRPGEEAGDVVDELITSLGLPRTLSAVGVGAGHFEKIAENAMRDRWIHTNPRRIDSPAQILEILRAAA